MFVFKMANVEKQQNKHKKSVKNRSNLFALDWSTIYKIKRLREEKNVNDNRAQSTKTLPHIHYVSIANRDTVLNKNEKEK